MHASPVGQWNGYPGPVFSGGPAGQDKVGKRLMEETIGIDIIQRQTGCVPAFQKGAQVGLHR
jgi:hypothetical protein